MNRFSSVMALTFMLGFSLSCREADRAADNTTANPSDRSAQVDRQTPVQGPDTLSSKGNKRNVNPPDPESAARIAQIKSAIEQGLDTNKADQEGRTPLMMAAFEGLSGVVKLLLENGAKVDQLDIQGRSALMYAASGPFPETVQLLIDYQAMVNRVDKNEGWTALMLAAAEGHRPVVELLLENGADREISDKDGDKAIDHARERGQELIVSLLNR